MGHDLEGLSHRSHQMHPPIRERVKVGEWDSPRNTLCVMERSPKNWNHGSSRYSHLLLSNQLLSVDGHTAQDDVHITPVASSFRVAEVD